MNPATRLPEIRPLLPTTRVELVRDPEGASLLAREWDDLFTRCPDATPFQRPEWLLAWMHAFRPAQPVIVLVRREGVLVGLAPFYLQTGPEMRLAPLGNAISDYYDWLIDPVDWAETLQCICRALHQIDVPWQLLDLTDLPDASLLVKGEASCLETSTVLPHDVCPALTLPYPRGELHDNIPLSQWRSLKTARNRSLRAARCRIVQATSSNCLEMLEALFLLHGKRWSSHGQPGVLASRDVQAFHRRAAPVLMKKGLIRLFGLQAEQRWAAILYVLSGKQTLYLYSQGFDPDFAELSPGTQVVAAAVEAALLEGRTRLDFLRGREPYKYAWGAQDVPTFRFQLRRAP